MKTKKILILLALVVFTFEANSFARVQNSRRLASDSEEGVSEPKRFGLGFSTLQSIIPGGSTGSIAILVELDKLNSITGFLSLPSTSPFSFGVAGLYKHTICGNRAAGFHVGGGVGMGSATSLGLGLNILGGIHFEMPGASQISVNLDGGPSFVLIASTPAQTSFQVSAFSPALGATIVYSF